MAYEEKTNYDDDTSLYSFLRLVNILIKKWWVVLIFMISFALLGFIFSRITYTEQYSSQIIFNVSNKDKDVAGAAATYVTQSDAQASGMIANNFKELVENGNDFITLIQENVEQKTGKKYDKKYLRRLMSVSLVTDGTLVYITVTSDDKELSNVVSNAIKDSYAELTTNAFPTANFTISDKKYWFPANALFTFVIASFICSV
jgi:capsular polysaccharide biosynthesis protein